MGNLEFGRKLKCLLIAALAISACSSHSVPKVKFLLDWTIEPNYVGFIVAQEMGLFKKRGLDVELQEGSGGSITTQAVALGHDYVIGSSSGGATAIAVSRGLPVRSTSVIFPKITTVIFSRAETPILRPAELLGKTIGLVAGSVTVDEYRALLNASGLKREQIREVGVSVDPSPLLTKQVDALIDYGDQMPASMIAKGQPIALLKVSDFGVKQYGLNIIANESALNDARAETVRGITEAINEGYAFVRNDPEKAIEIFMSLFPQRDRGYVEQSIKMVVAELGTGPIGRQTREGWSNTIDSLQNLGLLEKKISVDNVASPKFLED